MKAKRQKAACTVLAVAVTLLNDLLLEDPTPINLDKYGDGWIFELECSGDELLNAEQYLEHLESAWEVAQRTIKGQANA